MYRIWFKVFDRVMAKRMVYFVAGMFVYLILLYSFCKRIIRPMMVTLKKSALVVFAKKVVSSVVRWLKQYLS